MKRYLVYFFKDLANRVKIGYCAGNLYKRKLNIQNGAGTVELLGVVLCKNEKEMRLYEKALHKQFKGHRISHEWFWVCPEILAYIQEFTESGQDILERGYKYCREYDRKSRSEYQRKYQRERRQNDPEYRKRLREYKREYNQRPEVKEQRREYRQRPEVKERERKRKQSPEYKKNQREYRAKNRITPTIGNQLELVF